jgi:hypothetical protein
VVVNPGTMSWYPEGLAPPPTGFPYGGVGWPPVAGDWNGDGQVGPGAVDPGGVWHPKNSYDFFPPDLAPFAYGLGSWVPLVGHWLPVDSSSAPRMTGKVQALPPIVNEPQATRDATLAAPAAARAVEPTPTPAAATPSASFPQASAVADASTGWQGVVPGVGDPLARSALARRARTAALDQLFTTGLD